MKRDWTTTVPVLEEFALVADPARYAALPDDWLIGLSDVVDFTGAIERGAYKAVNLAGAGTISGVLNALEGNLSLFVFGGDGARFAVPPQDADVAADALARVAMWVQRDLGLQMRVGMISVADIRAAGFDSRVAFWQASENARYAMFLGGGLEWADDQLKQGVIGIAPASPDLEPDLTGLSCQWGTVQSRNGSILSLIVKPVRDADQTDFLSVARDAVVILEEASNLNPVPEAGPVVRWPSASIALQSRIGRAGWPLWLRKLAVVATAALIWLIFRFGIRIKGFDPARYRREITENTDFRKFDDGLMMTVDCAPEVAAKLRIMLDAAADQGVVRYGMHLQDEALMTCVVPSLAAADHMHFIDGAGGGYASAARNLSG